MYIGTTGRTRTDTVRILSSLSPAYWTTVAYAPAPCLYCFLERRTHQQLRLSQPYVNIILKI